LALVMAQIPFLLCPSLATRGMRHRLSSAGEPGRKNA